VVPDLRLTRQDPFGLRFIALTVLVMGLMFGSLWRAATVTGLETCLCPSQQTLAR